MTTSSDGITLLGSEMLTWSDLHGEAGAFGGLIAPHLLRGFGGTPDRALVAGPVTPEVIRGLAAGFGHTDVLTRSWLDAQELRAQLPDDVSVSCGPLDRLARPEQGYDVVVAVAGIDRLHSAEEETPTWQQVLGDLAGLLHDRGELYVAVGNPVGVDRLVALDPVNRQHDAAWPQGHAHVGEPSGTLEVLGHLAGLGLDEVDTWLCHGPRTAPRAAASRSVLVDRPTDSVVLRSVRAAYASSRPAGGDLRDPGVVATELLRAGLGAATAPLSVLHVRRSGGPAAEQASVLLVEEHGAEASTPVACRLEPAGTGWTRAVLTPAASYAVTPGLFRDLTRLEGTVPEGEVLADRLRDLLAQHDASQAGVHVRELRDWLGSDGTSEVDRDRVPVLLDQLVLGSDGLVLDAGFVAESPAPRDVVLLRALLHFAAALLASGSRQPWSPAATPRALATSLAAAGDLEVDDELFAAAVALDESLRVPGQRVPDLEAPLGGADVVATLSYAELVELAEALAARAAEQDAHVVWLLKTVQIRQRRVRKARGNIRELSESREYRLGRRIFWLRDLRRRRREAREEAERPRGVWRDRSEEVEEDADPTVYVEEDLVPPGYRPHDGVEITPTGVDPGDTDPR